MSYFVKFSDKFVRFFYSLHGGPGGRQVDSFLKSRRETALSRVIVRQLYERSGRISFMAEKETGRVEAFSDGVFAIAITLLILEIKVPKLSHEISSPVLAAALLDLWPSFIAFLLSFFAILIMWINHHGLFNLVRRVNPGFLYANGFLLLLICFVPFPTAVLAEHLEGGARDAAAAFYCGTFIFISIGYNLIWQCMVRGDLLKSEVPAEHVRKITRAYLLGMAVYAVSTIVALFNGYLGLGMNLSLWILWSVLGYRPSRSS